MVAVAEGLHLPAPAVDVTSEVGVGVRQLVRQDDGSEVLDRRAEQTRANADDAPMEADAGVGAEGEGAVLVDAEHVLVDLENPAHQVQLLRFAQQQLGELSHRWQVLSAIADQTRAVRTLAQYGDRCLEPGHAAQQTSQGILVRM